MSILAHLALVSMVVIVPLLLDDSLPDAGSKLKEPTKLKDAAAVDADAAVQAGIEGVVVLKCLISPQGKVTEVKVLRGVPLLDTAAVEAARQWVCTPTLMDGVPVPVIMTLTVRFDLRGR